MIFFYVRKKVQVQILCHPDIRSADDPEVLRAVQTTVDEYHKEGRVFPHGQLRFVWVFIINIAINDCFGALAVINTYVNLFCSDSRRPAYFI